MLPTSKEVIMHNEEIILFSKRMFMSTQTAKMKFLIILSTNRKPRNCLSFKESCYKNQKNRKRGRSSPDRTQHKRWNRSWGKRGAHEWWQWNWTYCQKKYNYNVPINKEGFGSDGEKQNWRAEINLNQILESPTVSIENLSGIVHIDNQTLGVKASTFLYNTKQSTKKINIQKHLRALLALELPSHLVLNTYAKKILEASESEEDNFASPRGQSGS